MLPAFSAGVTENTSSDKVEINNESSSQARDNNTEDTVNEDVEKKNSESMSTSNINNELHKKNSTYGTELKEDCPIKTALDNSPTVECSTVNGAKIDKSIVNKLTSNNESSEKFGSQLNNEGNRLKTEGRNSSEVSTDCRKKDANNKSNPNESKKGKVIYKLF